MVRLIPKDEKFQELFVEDAQIMLEAARKLEDMIGVYDRLDERVAEIRALEHQGDEIDTEVEVRLDRAFITPFDREDIHELRVADRRRARRHPGGRRDVRHLRRQGADRRRPRMAGILAAQAGQLNEAIGKLEGAQGPRAEPRDRSTTSRTRRTACRAPPWRACSAVGTRRSRSSSGATSTRAREHDRRRRGRGRGHRADRRQERLTAAADAARRAPVSACGRASSPSAIAEHHVVDARDRRRSCSSHLAQRSA